MLDDEISVQIEGQPSDRARGKERSIDDVNAEADRYAKEAAYWRNERAKAFQERDQAIRENVATKAAALETEATNAKNAYRAALDIGASDEIIRWQREMSRIEAQRNEVERAQQRINSRPTSTGNPAEDLARTLPPKSAEFIRQNPHLAADERGRAKLIAAHYDAASRGIPVESDQYFDHALKFCGDDTGNSVQSPRARQKNNAQQPNTVTFKTREDYNRARETAEALGLSFNEYLRRKQITDTSPPG